MTANTTRTDGFERDVNINAATVTTTVLLVDDDGDFASLVADYLEEHHSFEVRTETDAETALDRLAESDDISCVISDYAMPGMDGLSFLDAVKSRYSDLPFILFAGQGSEEVASKAIRLGADDYLEKDTGETRYELLATRITNCVTIARQQQKLQDLYAAIEHAGHAMLVTDVDGTITYANPTMENISGYSIDELKGKTPALFKSGEHDREFYQELWETILDGKVWQGEVINEHKSGHQYVVDQTISPITENGKIAGFVAINRDITVRKRRERNLTFFQQAVDQVGTGIAAYDENGTIRYANDAYAEMLGTRPDDLEGDHITVINPEFDTDRFESYWDSFDVGETRRREGVNQHHDDDTIFPVDTVTTHIAVGEDQYHIGTIQDISERKERERELRMFREAVEEAGHAVLVTDTDGTIEYVNPAFGEMTGYDRQEAIGNTPAMLRSGEHDQAFYQDLWETITNQEVWDGEIINECKDGEQFVIDQTIAPLTDDGELAGFVAINRDITELKEQRRELRRQNERLETFGRTVAHDLRNPLNVIDANLDMARHADNPAEAYTKMQEAIDRMEELIDELLALAKQGKSVLEPESAPLGAVVRAAWSTVDTRVMSLDIVANETFLMDESRVQELFANLFRNAREHAGDDTSVRIGTLPDGFFVEDDGPGIPPDKRDAVLTSGFTTSKKGTGFGLSIVTQIAEAHDWEVMITDGSDGGARFEFHGVKQE